MNDARDSIFRESVRPHPQRLDQPHPRRNRALVVTCNVLVAPLLLTPLAIGVISADMTLFAFSAIAAVVVVRILLLNVVPWLEGDQDDPSAA